MRRAALALALTITLAGCGSSRAASPSDVSADPTGSTEASPTDLATTVPPTTIVPDGLPTKVLGTSGGSAGHSFGGTELALVDRTTGTNVPVLTAAELGQLFTFGSPLITAADLSPDGHHAVANITWDPEHDPYQALVYVNLDDPSSPIALTQPAPDTSYPAVRFSPDGTSVAKLGYSLSFVSIPGATSTSTSIQVAYAAVGLAWSPTGKQLAWGNHFEREPQLSSTVVTMKTPGSAEGFRISDQSGPGVNPWWDASGRLHGTGSSASLIFAVDTDRDHTWVLGKCSDDHHEQETACWWPATEWEGAAQTLAGVPADVVPMAW